MTGHTYERVYTDPVATRVSKETAPSSSSSLLDSPAASVDESAKFNPRPLAVVISTAGGGALPPTPSSDDDDALITVTYLGSRRLSGPASHGRGDRCVDAVVRSPPPPFRKERKLRWNFPGNNCEG